MKEAKFKNTRFDPSITTFLGIAEQMAKAFGYTADLGIDKELAQLIRLRVAQKNQCSYCVILHAQTAREIGIHPSKVDNISSYFESDLYDEKEKNVLAYSDALTDGNPHNFENFHNQLVEDFSEKEIAEIAAIVINMNVWTRLKLAQGQTPFFE